MPCMHLSCCACGTPLLVTGRRERRYICWKLEVGQLPSCGDNRMSHCCACACACCFALLVTGRHERRYICWKLEVGQLPGNGQRVASSQCLRLRHRRLYLVAEHMGDAGGGAVPQLCCQCS
jgi:hypothetical protein